MVKSAASPPGRLRAAVRVLSTLILTLSQVAFHNARRFRRRLGPPADSSVVLIRIFDLHYWTDVEQCGAELEESTRSRCSPSGTVRDCEYRLAVRRQVVVSVGEPPEYQDARIRAPSVTRETLVAHVRRGGCFERLRYRRFAVGTSAPIIYLV